MDIDIRITRLPQYYGDDLQDEAALLPFMVCPVGTSQDTLIFGPQSIASKHETFINSLYAHIGSSTLEAMAARAFLFQSNLCIAVILPTRLTDEAGRGGLTITIGFFVSTKTFHFHSEVFADYLRMYFKAFNRHLSLSLPKDGADQLLRHVRDAYADPEGQKETLFRIEAVIDTLLLASTTVCARLKKNSLLSRLPRLSKMRKSAKTILYSQDSDYVELLHIFMKELGKSIRGLGKTSVQEFSHNVDDGKGLMVLIPLVIPISDAKDIKLGKCRGKSYLKIY
jgi:hypothetical protein